MQHANGAGNSRTTASSAWGENVLLGLLLLFTAFSAGALVWQTISPVAVVWGGLTMDRLSAALTLLVASVGAATFRYSQRYLQGEPGRQRFLLWLFFTVVTAYLLMLSTHLLLLFAAWSATSIGLHQLLTHYEDRPQAVRPARKKFLISRLGDVALVLAIAIIGFGWGTLELHAFVERVTAAPVGVMGSLVALLVVAAALTKSAQFPFHSWLPETMEAPTPVSALMHAGVINAGGALLLRFAPLLVQVPLALLLLSAVGTFTVVLGMLAMWAQVKVKRTLAWSTVNQMGFMMVQCGLAAFPAAMLHIIGHGCYKAWSFLRSGELPSSAASIPPKQARPVQTLLLVALGTALAIPMLWVAAQLTGFAPLHSPGELALAMIMALSVGQLWVAKLSFVRPGGANSLLRLIDTALASFAVVLFAFALYRGAGWFLRPVLGELPAPTGFFANAVATLPVLALVALTILQAVLPAVAHWPVCRAFYVHALHGFYFGAIADGIVDRVWAQSFLTKEGTARV